MVRQIDQENAKPQELVQDDEPQIIIEKVDIKLTTIIKFILSFLCIIFILILILKPDFVINYFKQYLNAEYGSQKVSYQQDLGEDEIIYEEEKIKISRKALYYLLQDAIQKDYINRIEFTDKKVIFMSDVSKNDVPLWIVLSLRVEKEKDLKIDEVGFGRFGFPGVFKDRVLQRILDVGMDFEKTTISSIILSRLFGSKELQAISIRKIEITDQYIILYVDLQEDFIEDTKEYIQEEIIKFRNSFSQ